jgi:hypothetical protein
MERKFKPSDVKKLSNICNDIKKSLSFDNPIIENRKLSRDNTRFKKLMEYAVPTDELREKEENSYDVINDMLSQYGWKSKKTENGLELINRLGKVTSYVVDKGSGKYAITDTIGNKLLTGRGQLEKSIERVVKDYFFGQKLQESKNIIFLKENDAKEVLDILYNESPLDAIEYLKQWHTKDAKVMNEHVAGTSDEIFEDGDYIMYYNKNLGYIGLNHKS